MARFSPSDLEAVRQAVGAAEGRTSGEIVPYVVARSANHEAIAWRGAAAGALLFALGFWLVRTLVAGWSMPVLHSAWAPHIALFAGAAVGLVIARTSPPVFRLLAGGRYLDRVVHERAVRAFVDDEVFDTRDRTGIVLLVSLLERRIEVFGDAGINAAVQKDDWADVVGIVREGLRGGRPAEALVEAIGRCGELLREKGVTRREDDENEISDKPRIDPDLT